MTDQHTPGPWHIDDESSTNSIFIRHDPQNAHAVGDEVCSLYSESAGITTLMTANARLIAAAPDLLEAAQLLEAAEDSRDGCEECEGEGEPEACGNCFPAFDDARIKRRLAIAKAAGKSKPVPPAA